MSGSHNHASIRNRTWSLGLVRTRREAPSVGCTPAATCHDFYFIYKRKEKKICNKRQTRVRLGAFIPQRKDSVSIVRHLAVTTGSAPSLSPRRTVLTMEPLGAWVSRPGCGTKCLWPVLLRTQIVRSFAGTPAQSPPVVSLLKVPPDPRRDQGWDNGSRGD